MAYYRDYLPPPWKFVNAFLIPWSQAFSVWAEMPSSPDAHGEARQRWESFEYWWPFPFVYSSWTTVLWLNTWSWMKFGTHNFPENIFKNLFSFLVFEYFCLHIYLWTIWLQYLQGPEEGIRSPGPRVNRWLWVAWWVIDSKLGSLGRAASPLNY